MTAMALTAKTEIAHVSTSEEEPAKGIEPGTGVHRYRLFGEVPRAGLAMCSMIDRFGVSRVMHTLLNEGKNKDR